MMDGLDDDAARPRRRDDLTSTSRRPLVPFATSPAAAKLRSAWRIGVKLTP